MPSEIAVVHVVDDDEAVRQFLLESAGMAVHFEPLISP
jgi:FixJ family two-component response regulator